MSDADNAAGLVQVKVSPKAVNNAVRNILVNEMGMDRASIREEIVATVKAVAEKEIEAKVLSYLRDNNYDGAKLHDRVKIAMQHQIDDLKPIIKNVARELVTEAINKDIEGVVEGVIRDGLKVRLGWSREARIQVEQTPNSKQQWVAISDRLPPSGKTILVYHGNNYNSGMQVSPATYMDDKFREIGSTAALAKVTHWRSLPDSPTRDVD